MLCICLLSLLFKFEGRMQMLSRFLFRLAICLRMFLIVFKFCFDFSPSTTSLVFNLLMFCLRSFFCFSQLIHSIRKVVAKHELLHVTNCCFPFLQYEHRARLLLMMDRRFAVGMMVCGGSGCVVSYVYNRRM